jgi:hypothetical protein
MHLAGFLAYVIKPGGPSLLTQSQYRCLCIYYPRNNDNQLTLGNPTSLKEMTHFQRRHEIMLIAHTGAVAENIDGNTL